ncbi:glycosyltransferase [Cellulosimicrobium sp. NPDC057127]|uniref:glycosyltransferase n=1 Tax=Cellulosimicrobium sp. NPDC057127 TaxID=3346026 RepID=UPI00362784AB
MLRMPSPRALVVSFSDISRDSRVLRQVSAVAEHAAVTTLSYGPQPSSAVEHLELPAGAVSLPQTPAGVANLALRRLTASELAAPGAQKALELAAGRTFDVVVANDARSLALAHRLAGGAPVWADMHEWAPEERTHVLSWRLLVSPLMDHLCRTYLPKVEAVTTVGPAIARLYEQRYGVRTRVMRNAPRQTALAPTPTEEGIVRLVHSGGAVPGRSLETMIDVAAELGPTFPLDLYLVPANDGGKYLNSLKARARDHAHVTLHPPVPPADLPTTLNAYDVGVFWIPPFNTNARLTLPNKLFDYVQARLAVAIGPSLEMADVVHEYGLGPVSSGFDAASIVESLKALDAETIEGYKRNSHTAAAELSFEHESRVAHSILRELLGR